MDISAKQRQLIEDQIKACRASLLELQKTCCINKRSEKMNGLINLVDLLGNEQLQAPSIDVSAVAAFIEQVEEVGAALGTLYATCCTPTREPIYAAMFKSLSKIHLRLLKLQHS